MSKIPVEILGLSTSTVAANVYALVLKEVDGTRRLPIVVGHQEAQAIALEMEGILPPRPLTHDLFRNVIELLSSAVTEVIINELDESTFYSQIVIDDHIVISEARPSDSIALAVRFQAPIFVDAEILEIAGYEPDDNKGEFVRIQTPKSKKTPTPPPQQKTSAPKFSASTNKDDIDLLNQQLSEAIANEDYERAASLRDEISKLESKN